MVLTMLADAVPDPAQVQYPPEPSCLVAIAQPDVGAEIGCTDETWPAHEFCTAVSVLIGNLLPTQKVSVETELSAPFVASIVETAVQPLIAPARFVSVAMILTEVLEFE